MATNAIAGIMTGEIPAFTIYDGKEVGLKAFLDIHPATPGHVLVAAAEEADQWSDLPDHLLLTAARLGMHIGRHQRRVLPAARRIIRLTFGDQVPRFHDHYVPTYEDADVVNRMHPDSGRMQEPLNWNGLRDMQATLQFPDDIAAAVTADLLKVEAAGLDLELFSPAREEQ